MGDKDTIYRQDAIDAIHGAIIDFFDICDDDDEPPMTYKDELLLEINKAISGRIKQLLSVQPEPLTDKEQRIFLAAMAREEKVCEEVDRNYVREPYEESLTRVCKEIKRKVKGALWT